MSQISMGTAPVYSLTLRGKAERLPVNTCSSLGATMTRMPSRWAARSSRYLPGS